MAVKNSRLENEESSTDVRVVLIGGVATESFGEDSTFEIHRCESVSEITRFLAGAQVNVLLIDLGRLSDGERVHLRKQMAQFSTVLVLAIAESIDDKVCESLLRMGCVGSLRGSETPATMLRALKAVIAGELWFPRTVLSRVLRSFLVAQDPDRLTAREHEILGLIGDDLNNQQVADKLFISRETVRWHIKSLNAKLGIRTRRGLRDHVRLLHRLDKTIPAQREAGKNPQPRMIVA
jgi:DNA-binding NarL/FixJ family response regulator